MELRTLYPDGDEALFQDAWAWRSTYPRLVKQWDMVTDFNQWLGMMGKRVSIGMFNPELSALITLEPRGDDVYECHVDCPRNVDKADLMTALLSIRKAVFDEWGATEIFAGIVSRNRGIVRLAN